METRKETMHRMASERHKYPPLKKAIPAALG